MAIRDYVIRWKSLDEKFLDNLINEWDLDEEELIERGENHIIDIDSNETLCTDINILIYQALLMIIGIVEDKVNEFLKEELDHDKLKYSEFEYYPEIYVNYLDSGIDDELYAQEIVTKDSVANEEKLIEYLEDKGVIERIDYD